MSQHRVVTSPPRDAASADAGRRTLYRAAGWGGIGAFVAWAVQPVIVAIAAAADAPEWPDWAAYAGDRPWAGPVEAAVFCGIGVGMLFFVLGVDALIRRAGGRGSVGAQVGFAMGVLGAASWVLFAGASMAAFTSVGPGIPEVAADPAQQAALIHVLDIAMTGFGVAFALSTAGWTVMLITTGRRAGVIGMPLAVVSGLFLVVFLVPFTLPFSVPWGMIGFVLQALVLGVAFLVKSRRV